jgi:hypothetical protein
MEQVCRARLPISALALLAEVRCTAGVTVRLDGEQVWIDWPHGNDEILRQVLAAPQVELFEERDGAWFRNGRHLPTPITPPAAEGKPLQQVLFPASIDSRPSGESGAAPIRLHLVPDECPRPTTAFRCHLGALAQWADHATTLELWALQAVRWRFEVLVRGTNLPAIEESERFWGDRVLVPLGARPDPLLPESALCTALGVTDDEIALLFPDGIDVIPLKFFQPLTRAALRIGMMGFG